MCLILFSVRTHPKYKLVIAANRDEFFARRTEPAHFWKDHPEILGGRDLEANGTWMAMTRSGKVAMVTNYRDPAHINPAAPSRGLLVTGYLLSDAGPEKYLQQTEPSARLYNGFNLLAGDCDHLFYFSNYDNGIRKAEPGLHGLSNHLLETPWPKVQLGKEKLAACLKEEDVTPGQLLDMLYDERVAPVAQLPDTGIGLEKELELSSMFIKTDNYGTRCSTIVLINYENQATYAERVYDLQTYTYSTKTFHLDV